MVDGLFPQALLLNDLNPSTHRALWNYAAARAFRKKPVKW